MPDDTDDTIRSSQLYEYERSGAVITGFSKAGCFSVALLLVSTRVGGRTAVDSHVRVEGLGISA